MSSGSVTQDAERFPFLSKGGQKVMTNVSMILEKELGHLLHSTNTPDDVGYFKNDAGNAEGSVVLRAGKDSSKFIYKEERARRKQGQSSGLTPVERSVDGVGSESRSEGIGGVADLGPPSVQRMATRVENGGSESERWTAALSNLTEIGTSIGSLQNLLLGKAVYVDEDAFAQASAQSNQHRMVKAQERRIRDLEKELDAAVSASRHARAEKREAENLQRAAERRAQEVLQELEDTTHVFKLHLEELRIKQAEVEKKDADIKVLQAINEAMRKEPRGSKHKKPS